MEYYHELVTQKSWDELQSLRSKLDFVLIGGWATYLYTKTLKSKDIDIIVEYDKLPLIKKHYQLIKNDRLLKYEAIKGEVQIDIYLPHYSKLGIPVEILTKNIENVEGFAVLEINYLTALKIYTLQQRGRSRKGRKDFIDVIALVKSGNTKWKKVKEILEEYNLKPALNNLESFLNENFEVPELSLSKHQFAKIKKKVLDT